MNKTLKLNFFLFILSLFCLSLSAQEKMIPSNQKLDREEFYSVIEKAYQKTRTQKYRIKYTSEKDFPTEKNKRLLLTEFAPPNRYREVSDFYEGSKLRHYEEIQIGETIYVKFDDENWRKKDEENIVRIVGGSLNKSEYIFVGIENVSDKTADLFQTTQVWDSSEPSETKTLVQKYWISADGLMLKQFASATYAANDKFIAQTQVYEYDSTIQINAPTIKTVRRKNLKKRQ